MTVKQLKEALNDYPDNAEILIFESEEWIDRAGDFNWCLKDEYLSVDRHAGKMLIIIPEEK